MPAPTRSFGRLISSPIITGLAGGGREPADAMLGMLIPPDPAMPLPPILWAVRRQTERPTTSRLIQRWPILETAWPLVPAPT